MDESSYSVRVDRAQGVIEISGPDKDWIAAQIETLMPVLTAESAAPKRNRAKAEEGGGSSEAQPEKTRKSSARSRSSTSSMRVNPALSERLTDEVKTKLQSYLEARSKKAGDAQSQVTVIATFLLDELGWAEVTADDLFTVYSDMGMKIPSTRNALSNAQARKGYFTAPNEGKHRVSHHGLNFARHDSPN